MNDTVIYLFKNDFRLHDNPALYEASKHQNMIIAYIHDEHSRGKWKLGEAKKWWLHYALSAMENQINRLGGHLTIRKGDTVEELIRLINETSAHCIYWNREYEPAVYSRDRELAEKLTRSGFQVKTFESCLLLPPWTIINKQKKPYKVFTHFYKQVLAVDIPLPLPVILEPLSSIELPTVPIEELRLLPRQSWADNFLEKWNPTEEHAINLFNSFARTKISDYHQNRDVPSHDGTSRLSPYLTFGQISARSMFLELKKIPDSEEFIRQLLWREFSYYLLWHFPHSSVDSLNNQFHSFQWDQNQALYKVWTEGNTGYPIVDAGMRELWKTGYMHNRVRMIVASFLTKHLLLPWQKGAEWFWDTLLDADLANNSLGWQWVAGTGVDSAPYFRIMNPIIQGEKFDSEGEYIKRWIPSLRNMPSEYIHKPWEAPAHILEKAGVILGNTYPEPVVNHKRARLRTLERYEQMKKEKKPPTNDS
ncbi:DNA photolyase family protein [Cytobacillus spongiae]|jgi:deoxyribodipyrimidine photo-lyase|uniref:cryptochrome/photolyase family protein n=1 Tax=Cytobacillus spongiae TaxID=2901381 RepID=UPI001F3DDDAF|nr:deoxyribodipyrimidine photo-lyase [Cytobacillus spongiae]UII56830.1 DNA photolyase family protein [Cytobacillus spongiae]